MSQPSFTRRAADLSDRSGRSDPQPLADGRRALEQVLRRHPVAEPISTTELRDAVRCFCADAHRAQLRPEQLVIAVKSAWAMLPESRARRNTPVHTELLDRLVSLCITEYFEMQPPPIQKSQAQ